MKQCSYEFCTCYSKNEETVGGAISLCNFHHNKYQLALKSWSIVGEKKEIQNFIRVYTKALGWKSKIN